MEKYPMTQSHSGRPRTEGSQAREAPPAQNPPAGEAQGWRKGRRNTHSPHQRYGPASYWPVKPGEDDHETKPFIIQIVSKWMEGPRLIVWVSNAKRANLPPNRDNH